MSYFLQVVIQLSLFLGLAGNKAGDKISFRFFVTVSSAVYISPLIFTLAFSMFSFYQLFFSVIAFCQALRFSVAVPQVLRISESFFTSFLTLHFLPHLPQYREYYGYERAFFTRRHYLPYTPSYHLAQPAIIKASLGSAVLHWSLQGLPLRFETQTRPICLLESNST